jgi:hypothetical protein
MAAEDPQGKRCRGYLCIADPISKSRSQHLIYDFDERGEVRKTRIPRPPTVVVTMNNVEFLRDI